MTCWRRLRDWQDAGIWRLIHFALLDWLSRFGQIDWSCAVLDKLFGTSGFWGAQTDRIQLTEPSWAASVT